MPFFKKPVWSVESPFEILIRSFVFLSGDNFFWCANTIRIILPEANLLST